LGDRSDWASCDFDDHAWKEVTVPHNWEDYHGYPSVSHGNLHGTAWYRTRIEWNPAQDTERLYAFFEGVGSYAEVFCNGKSVGSHAGGRTTFTIDLTPALKAGRNLIAVRAHHPENIDDLPFVCGGCWGSPNTEGSQPFGMFRPVWFETTGPLRVAPFGLHILTPEVSQESARIEVRAELINPDPIAREALLKVEILDPSGRSCGLETMSVALAAGEQHTATLRFPRLLQPELWEPSSPHLYRAIATVAVNGECSHQEETTFGLRWVAWPRIFDPEADWKSRSPDRRGRLIGTGEEPLTDENNGLTRILSRIAEAPLQTTRRGVSIHLARPLAGDTAELAVSLTFLAAHGTMADVLCEIQNEGGTIFFHQHRARLVWNEALDRHVWEVPPIHAAHRWSSSDPYLHKLLVEVRAPDGTLWERSETLFGIRAMEGALNLSRPVFEQECPPTDHPHEDQGEGRLLLNGKPLFLNGTCEYETMLGNDHAFTDEQIEANVAMMHAAGFNAFRDAHHPHNLRYYSHWDRLGIVCWTQMGSKIWFDTPAFRKNFKRLVEEWVRERRNHPCILLWGLQNESALPKDFAREVRDLIRTLDPTSPTWRLTTTCNGGKGSDWNVPQEWSGTYGGNCNDYDLERLQLVGEYGAWRAFGVHTECDYRGDENDRSESWACYAMETKIRLGEVSRERAVGHFHWVFNSFPNPGRTAENYEGPRNGQIGSLNNKGLVTAWNQPSDLFYLFRANYADPLRDPMVYIVSHTWPDRWTSGPRPRRVEVYSNCDEVELFNGFRKRSLGIRQQPGRGRHFVWEGVAPEFGILHAVGRTGASVAEDLIVLDALPADPESIQQWCESSPVLPADPGRALYRVSCGEDEASRDTAGRDWLPDAPWSEEPQIAYGWTSWGNDFPNIDPGVASRGFTPTPVRNTAVPELYRRYRYGRNRLRYIFRCSPGSYRLRLHFTEPWYGVGDVLGAATNCRGWRLFDIAVNGRIVERDLDIWNESGGAHRALIREYDVLVDRDRIEIDFPFVRVNQALLCGMEVFALS
jgi:beta-galactosidase